METLLVVLVASLVDPIRLVPSLIAGFAVRSWAQVWIAAAIISVIMIAIAAALQANVNPIIGTVATVVDVSAAYLAKFAFRKPRGKEQPGGRGADDAE